MNIPISKIKVLVIESFLYNGDASMKGLINGEIIGVSSYPNQTLTFHILVNGEYLYSDMPIHSFIWKTPNYELKYKLEDLVYSNCETLAIDNFTLDCFLNTDVSVFMKKLNVWINGEYLTSFDFYEGNDSCHLIKLENGYFTLAPNHKINWSNKEILSDYLKNKKTWKI